MTNPIIIAKALKKSKLWNRDICNLSSEVAGIKNSLVHYIELNSAD